MRGETVVAFYKRLKSEDDDGDGDGGSDSEVRVQNSPHPSLTNCYSFVVLTPQQLCLAQNNTTSLNSAPNLIDPFGRGVKVSDLTQLLLGSNRHQTTPHPATTHHTTTSNPRIRFFALQRFRAHLLQIPNHRFCARPRQATSRRELSPRNTPLCMSTSSGKAPRARSGSGRTSSR